VGEGAVRNMIFLKRERITKFFLCIEGELGKIGFVSLLYCPPQKKNKQKTPKPEQEPYWKTLKKRRKNPNNKPYRSCHLG